MMGLMTLMAAASLATAPAPAADKPVQIGQGAETLYGSMMRPDHVTAPTAVLMISGSGPEDRDGDDVKDGGRSRTMRLLALALAERGVVSLRYDKRGVGESAPAGTATSVAQAAGDAAVWVRFLARQPGVRCVVVLGHSEGALIGTLAAAKVKLCGLVLVSGTSRNLGDLIEVQGAALKLPPEIQARVHEIIEALKADRPLPQVPSQYDGLFGPKALAYTRSQISMDPVAELARVKVPVLVVQGDNDYQARVEDARRLAAAAGVEPVIIPGMNHPLKLAPREVVANFMTYANPDLPLAPGVADAIGDFVRARR
jgi:pimeloyl-ACP methyl ester carboxylesterase